MTAKSALNDAISVSYFALEKIDNFDLDSTNPLSVLKMDSLNNIHNEAVKEVVRLVRLEHA